MTIVEIELTQDQLEKLIPISDEIGQKEDIGAWALVGQVYIEYVMPDGESAIMDSATLFICPVYGSEAIEFQDRFLNLVRGEFRNEAIRNKEKLDSIKGENHER